MKKSCNYRGNSSALYQRTRDFNTSYRSNESRRNQQQKAVARTKNRRTVSSDLNPHQVAKTLLLLTLVVGAEVTHTAQKIVSSKSRKVNYKQFKGNQQSHYKSKPHRPTNNKTQLVNSENSTLNNQALVHNNHALQQTQTTFYHVATTETTSYLNATATVATPQTKKTTQKLELKPANITSPSIPEFTETPIGLRESRMSSQLPVAYQPPLEKTIELEAALFLEILKPYKDLDPVARQKATLLSIQHRIYKWVTYGDDLNSIGEVIENWRTPENILERSGQGIDCEDYAILADFYARHAQEQSYLPENAHFGIFLLPEHALFYYEVTLPNEEVPEFYVIDTNTVSKMKNSMDNDKLTTLKEYFHRDSILAEDVARMIHFISRALLKENYLSYQPSVRNPGGYERSNLLHIRIPTAQEWEKRLNDRRQIDESISGNEISTIQNIYVKMHGEHTVSADAEHQIDLLYYAQALETKKYLGYTGFIGDDPYTQQPLQTQDSNLLTILKNTQNQFPRSSIELTQVATSMRFFEDTSNNCEKILNRYLPINYSYYEPKIIKFLQKTRSQIVKDCILFQIGNSEYNVLTRSYLRYGWLIKSRYKDIKQISLVSVLLIELHKVKDALIDNYKVNIAEFWNDPELNKAINMFETITSIKDVSQSIYMKELNNFYRNQAEQNVDVHDVKREILEEDDAESDIHKHNRLYNAYYRGIRMAEIYFEKYKLLSDQFKKIFSIEIISNTKIISELLEHILIKSHKRIAKKLMYWYDRYNNSIDDKDKKTAFIKITQRKVALAHSKTLYDRLKFHFEIVTGFDRDFINRPVESDDYESDDYMAAMQAIVTAVQVVLKNAKIDSRKDSIESHDILVDKNLTESECILAYDELNKIPEIKPYLMQTAITVFGILKGRYSNEVFSQTGIIPWGYKEQEAFTNACFGIIPKSSGFRSILNLKRSNAFSSESEYNQQFSEYRENHLDTEVAHNAYQVLQKTGLKYYELRKTIPISVWSLKLIVSNASGFVTWENADKTISRGWFRQPLPREQVALGGDIDVMQLDNGQALVISTIDGVCTSKLFTRAELHSNYALKIIIYKGNHNKENGMDQGGIYSVKSSQDGAGETHQSLYGDALVKNLLKPLWDDSYNPLLARAKEHQPSWPKGKNLVPYPILVKTKESKLKVGKQDTYSIIKILIKQGLDHALDIAWHNLHDMSELEELKRRFVPLYEPISRAIYEPGYNINIQDFTIEVASTVAMLYPVVGSIVRMSLTTRHAFKLAMKNGFKKGLRGTALRKDVKLSLMNNKAVRTEFKRMKNMAIETIWDLIDPNPLPFSGISSSMALLKKPLDTHSPNKYVNIQSGGKQITIEIPNDGSHHKEFLENPLAYKKEIFCSASPHRAKRGIGDLFCIKRRSQQQSAPLPPAPLPRKNKRILSDSYIDVPNQYSIYREDILKNKILEEAIHNPREKCESLLLEVTRFMEMNNFSNLRYRSMYFWVKSTDDMATIHFVVLGNLRQETFVFDLTAAQFSDRGMPKIDAPLVLPEPAWAKLYQQATTRKLIKYQDFNSIVKAKDAMHIYDRHGPMDELAFDPILLTEPVWYKNMQT